MTASSTPNILRTPWTPAAWWRHVRNTALLWSLAAVVMTLFMGQGREPHDALGLLMLTTWLAVSRALTRPRPGVGVGVVIAAAVPLLVHWAMLGTQLAARSFGAAPAYRPRAGFEIVLAIALFAVSLIDAWVFERILRQREQAAARVASSAG